MDSYGWIEYFSNGPLASKYARFIEDAQQTNLVTPTIVIYEVYKKLKREIGEELALEVQAHMTETRVVELTIDIASKAADISLGRGMAMADSIIYATAEATDSRIKTSDTHFKGLPLAEII